jgi:nucleoside-diphosphate-sugar epimerase
VNALGGRRIAVTGASGFLGHHLTKTLLAQGAEVVGLVRDLQHPRLGDLAHEGRFQLEAVELLDQASIERALATTAVDTIVHLAAYGVQSRDRDRVRAIAVNVIGASNVVAAALACRVSRVVQIGSSHEYGASESPLRSDAPLSPLGLYGATKAAGMLIGRVLAQSQLGLTWIGVRPFGLFGPFEDRDKLLPYVILRALARKPIEVTAGDQVRDYLYVEDAARAIALCITAPLRSGLVINIGSGRGIALRTLIETLLQLIDRNSRAFDLRFGARSLAAADVLQQVCDPTEQEKLLQFKPSVTLAEGLRLTIAWYQQRLARDEDRVP